MTKSTRKSNSRGYIGHRDNAEYKPAISTESLGDGKYRNGRYVALPRPLTLRTGYDRGQHLLSTEAYREARKWIATDADASVRRIAYEKLGVVSVAFPRWLVEKIPAGQGGNRARILTAAAIIGSTVNGQTVTLGQVSMNVGDTSQTKTRTNLQKHSNGVSFPLRFFAPELKALKDFATEARLSQWSSIVRTAAMIGLGAPYCREGVINDPIEYGDKEYRMSPEFWDTLMIIAGTMNRKLFESKGCAVLDGLLNIHMTHGDDGLRDILQNVLDDYTERNLAVCKRTIQSHKKNIVKSQVQATKHYLKNCDALTDEIESELYRWGLTEYAA